jgi:hypothetical protein
VVPVPAGVLRIAIEGIVRKQAQGGTGTLDVQGLHHAANLGTVSRPDDGAGDLVDLASGLDLRLLRPGQPQIIGLLTNRDRQDVQVGHGSPHGASVDERGFRLWAEVQAVNVTEPDLVPSHTEASVFHGTTHGPVLIADLHGKRFAEREAECHHLCGLHKAVRRPELQALECPLCPFHSQ